MTPVRYYAEEPPRQQFHARNPPPNGPAMAVSRSGFDRTRSLRPSIDELKLYLEDREENLLAELAYLRLLQQAVPDRIPRNFPAACPASVDCIGCGSGGLVRCSRCKAWYCSQRCQMSDWQSHRLNCVSLPTLENADGTPFHQHGQLPLRQPMVKPSAAQINVACENEVKVEQKDDVPAPPKATAPAPLKATDPAPPKATAPVPSAPEKPAEVPKVTEQSASKPPVAQISAPSQNEIKVERKADAPAPPKAAAPVPSAPEKPAEVPKVIDQSESKPSPSSRASRLAQVTANANGRRHVLLADLGSISVENGCEVWILDYSTETNLVWVQAERGISLCDELESLVAEEVRKGTKTASNPIKGEILLSEWKGAFYRAQITSIDETSKTANISFIDYGNTHVEALGKLQELPESIAATKFPPLASVVKLDKVPAIPVTEPGIEEKLNHMKAITEMALLKVTLVDGSSSPKVVTLKHANGKTLNDMLRDKLSEKPAPSRAEGPTAPQYKTVELKVMPGVDQKVVVLSAESPSEIFVAPEDAVSTFQAMPAQINAYVETLKETSFKPATGRACIAKDMDETWSRAVCLKEMPDGKFSVFYVDFGYKEDGVGAEKIRPISDDLLKTPFMAIRCALSGFQGGKADKDSIKKVMPEVEAKLVMFSNVSVQVLSSIDNTLVIKVPGMTLN